MYQIIPGSILPAAERENMVSLKISPVKGFMSSLLSKNVFDNFLFSEGEVVTFTKFSFSGYLSRDYYSADEWEMLEGRRYASWGQIRPYVYSVIRGNRTPVSFRLVMFLSDENAARVLKRSGAAVTQEQLGGFFLNLRFEKNEVHLVTGLSMKVFTLDKTLEHAWDQDMKTFLRMHENAWEEE